MPPLMRLHSVENLRIPYIEMSFALMFELVDEFPFARNVSSEVTEYCAQRYLA